MLAALGCAPEREPEAPDPPPPPPPVSTKASVPAPSPVEPAERERADDWVWVLPLDYGMRADKGGEGGFLAQRYHGAHNGVDLLAPLGTPVIAPCSGSAVAGKNSSHGKWLKLICSLPRAFGSDAHQRATLFFAHLSAIEWSGGEPQAVERAQKIAAVGKTGNASGSDIAPHLHFEIAFHDDEAAAIAETHSGRDQSDNQAVHSIADKLNARCLGPSGLGRRDGELLHGRRIDPFVLMSCLVAEKPPYKRPLGKLGEASVPWSQAYRAEHFDIDKESARVRDQ